MSEMHLKQPRFTHTACGLFTKNKERIQKLKVTHDSSYIYQKELHTASRKRASDKLLCNKAFNISKNPKYDETQRGLAPMVYNFFD